MFRPMRFRLIPSDQVFYDLFDRAADNAIAAAASLQDLVSSADRLDLARGQLVDLEHEGDEILATTLRRLDRSFVTPIDREDISRLISAIDDVVDSMHHIAELMVIVGMPTFPELVPSVELMASATTEAMAAVKALRNYKDLRTHIEKVGQIETECDVVYRKVLATLFSGDYSALDVIKNKDLIEAVEGTVDQLEDVADICESIYVKHA
jgi:predicted phosphate transport protein (TIGR00153 family)